MISKELDAQLTSNYSKAEGAKALPVGSFIKIEPRTRRTDSYTEAMSFGIYDPLWMLGRQWQFGRFQGNDCGSTVQTKILAKRQKINGFMDKNGKALPASSQDIQSPMEYDVERRPHTIDAFVRIESALHFLGMQAVSGHKDAVLETLKKVCSLDSFIPDNPNEPIEEVKARANTKMDKMFRLYGKRCFDGYKLFQLKSLPAGCSIQNPAAVLQEYKDWFKKKYHVMDRDTDVFWNERKLGYELTLTAGNRKYEAEDYHSGRLSWYSFDCTDNVAAAGGEPVTLGVLPTPAVFPAAPNRRLWEFENSRVQFNDYRNDDISALASSVIMQYTMMYSNDWMIVPMETEVGTVLSVEKIVVKDSFGMEFDIAKTFETVDGKRDDIGFTDRWALFANSYSDAYKEKSYFKSAPGLLCPPTLQRVEQGDPIEEVQFLRDEMANMVWGVEEKVSDCCGGSLDSRSRSDKVLSIIDEERIVDDSDVTRPEDADYSYLIQNRVPLHWIPFIPQKISPDSEEAKNGEIAGRDIIFRRARMPIWYKGDFQPVRPSSQLLALKYNGEKVVPRYVYEEEILGYGTKVGLYPQRTRWFNGTSFTWQGFEKKISGIQANSGLMFDALLDVEKKEE